MELHKKPAKGMLANQKEWLLAKIAEKEASDAAASAQPAAATRARKPEPAPAVPASAQIVESERVSPRSASKFGKQTSWKVRQMQQQQPAAAASSRAGLRAQGSEPPAKRQRNLDEGAAAAGGRASGNDAAAPGSYEDTDSGDDSEDKSPEAVARRISRERRKPAA